MTESIFFGLMRNSALLLALVVIFDLIAIRKALKLPVLRKILLGLLIGGIGLAIMNTPWVLVPGVVFDTRSVLLSISGIFFGLVPTIIAMAITSIYRLVIGGTAVWTGVLVILCSGALGIAFRYYRKKQIILLSWHELYLFGIVVHAVMLACMLIMPWETAQFTLRAISLPVMVIYPLGTALLGILMVNRLKRESVKDNLRRNEAILNTTQHIARIGGWEWDVEKQEMFWTDELYAIHGLSKDDPPATPDGLMELSLSCYNQEDQNEVLALFNECINTGKCYDKVFPFTAISGEKLWVRVKAEAVIENDKTVRVVGSLMDITSQKLIEEELREREQFTQTVLDNLPLGIAVNAVEPLMATYINDNFIKIYRTTREELAKPDSFWNAVYQDEKAREEIKKRVLNDIASGDPEKMVWQDIPLVREGEETSYITAMNIPLADKTMIISTVQDVTQRKKAEEKLQQNNILQEKMAALGRELAATLDLQKIYQSADSSLKEMIDCPIFAITLYEPDNHILKAAYYSNDGVVMNPEIIPVHHVQNNYIEGGRSEAFFKQTPIYSNNMHKRKNITTGSLSGKLNEPLSSYSIPMVVDGKVIGLLEIQSYKKDAYTVEDGDWLSVVANQIGLTVQNASQFLQIQQQLAEQSILSNIDLAIASSVGTESIYPTILQHITSQTFIDAVDIYLFKPEEQILRLSAGFGFRNPELAQVDFNLGEGTTGMIALDRRARILNSASEENPCFTQSEFWQKEEFAMFWGLPLTFHGELKGVLEIYSRSEIPNEPASLRFMESLAQQVAIAVDNIQLVSGLEKVNSELLKAYDATIEGWSKAMDMRDEETQDHTLRVMELTFSLAKEFGMTKEQLAQIRRGTLLHDIGKLGVPDQILLKPGPLSDEEWVIMKKHPVFAFEMLQHVDYLRSALAIPYCHHEKWDGTGYPRGLKAESIPLEARIFAIVDVWDALTSDRPYRKAWSCKEALQYITEQRGKHFDPEVTDIFLRIITETKECLSHD